jgi:tetratricopeptide (TPR) repeat protein
MKKHRATGFLLAGCALSAIALGQSQAKPGEKPATRTATSPKTPDKPKRARTVDDDINDAMESLRAVAPKAEALVLKGDLDGATKMVLDIFPDAKRTPAQTLVLGQAISQNERKLSYELLKQASEALADNAAAQFEWALAQHRAREYEGALRAYERSNELRPGNSPLLGMAAECALRLGRVERALELWKLCTEAKLGSQENFERLVCEINSREDPLAKRRQLVKKVAEADEGAAIQLILLDSDWPADWWTKGPYRAFLENDLALTGKWILPGGNPQVQEARCVGALAMLERPTKEKITDVLRRARYLIDEEATMPANPHAMVLLLKYAIRSGSITREDARAILGPKILEIAKTSKNRDVFEAASFLYLDTGKQDEVDRLGWQLAGDPRCAANLLSAMAQRKELKWDHPDLQKALKEFPENATIAALALQLGKEAGQPTKDLLIAAILAEYSRFSMSNRDNAVRPRADALRVYWKTLAEAQGQPAAQPPG